MSFDIDDNSVLPVVTEHERDETHRKKGNC